MRYFIAKNGSAVVVEKQAVEGTDADVDALVNKYKTNHPLLVVTELDQTAFDATVMVNPLTQAQKDWATFKAGPPVPSALQGVLYLAKVLGLE